MKKLKKDVIIHTKVGVLGGVGATMIGATGGSAAGLTSLSGLMSPLATVQGAAATMRQVKKLPKYKKKR